MRKAKKISHAKNDIYQSKNNDSEHQYQECSGSIGIKKEDSIRLIVIELALSTIDILYPMKSSDIKKEEESSNQYIQTVKAYSKNAKTRKIKVFLKSILWQIRK